MREQEERKDSAVCLRERERERERERQTDTERERERPGKAANLKTQT